MKILTTRRIAMGFLLTACLYYAFLLPYYYVGMFKDDAIYVLAAKSLARGEYSAISDLALPARPHFPPGFSLFLVPFVSAAGTHFYVLKWVSIGLVLLSGSLLFSLAQTWLTPGASLLALVLYIFNPGTTFSSCLVMSEPLFICLSLLSLILCRRILRETRPTWEPWLLGFLLGYAMLVRYTGVALAVAIIAGLIYAKRNYEAILTSFLSGVIEGSWILWIFWRDRRLPGFKSGDTILYAAGFRNGFSEFSHWNAFIPQWQKTTQMIFANDLLSIPNNVAAVGLQVRDLLALIVFVLIAYGFKSWKTDTLEKRALTLATIVFILTWYGIHLFWNASYSRYALPTLPIALILFISGCSRFYPRSVMKRFLLWMPGILTLAFCYTSAQNTFAKRIMSSGPEWRLPAATARWIREHTPRESLLLCAKPAELRLYTDHAGYGPIAARSTEQFRYFLVMKNISYIWARPFGSTSIDEAASWRADQVFAASSPDAFKVLYVNPSEATLLYAVVPDTSFVKAYGLYEAAALDFNDRAYDQGLKKLDQALIEYPGLVSALNAYGAGCLLSGKNPRIAEAKLKAAVRLKPYHALALYNLARAYKRLGREALSRQTLQRAKEAAKTFPEFQYALPMIEKGI